MIDEVVTLLVFGAVGIAWRVVRAGLTPRPQPRRDDRDPLIERAREEALVDRLATIAAWAARRGLARSQDGFDFEGRIDDRSVLVRSGLRGPSPVGVELIIAVALEIESPALVTAESEGPLAEALADLFTRPGANAVRSAEVTASEVRVRLAERAHPDSVDIALRIVDQFVRESRVRRPDTSSPYRS